MMIEIETQYMENYGNPDAPHWKPKFGSIYIVENAEDIDLVEVFRLIETSNPMMQEYVLTHNQITEEELKDIPDYEAPIFIKKSGDQFKATWVRSSQGFREPIVAVTETWTMLKEQGRTDFQAVYTLEDGTKIDREDFVKQYMK